MGSHWFHQKNAGKAHRSPEMQPYGYDPMRFHPEVQSYGGVSTVAARNSDSDHHKVDLTLRLGLPQYDLPDQRKSSTIPKTTPHCPRQHYSNFNSLDSYCQWLRQARTQYTAGNKSYGGWGYTAKQTGRTQDTGSSNDTGRLLGSRATIPGFGRSSNYYRTYDSAPAASNPVPWRRAPREMEAERCPSLEAAYTKQMGRAHCDGLMGFPEAEKRCTKCNSDDTPMWRKGPLGPKSLCNACGIKYRKDLERRKAAELALGTGRIGGGRGHYN